VTQDLISAVPGIFDALLGLVQAAATAQLPSPAVFPFELAQYEPGAYVLIHEIRGPAYEWENIGTFTQKETFEIAGAATVFVGDGMVNDQSVATDVLAQTMSLFQSCVMTPVMSHRTMPLLGTTGPSPFLMLPGTMGYESGPGDVGGGQGGWFGRYDWSFRFQALITPA
jgi:hypothetical protein